MVGTPLSQLVPSLSADTCLHAVTRRAVAESASDLTFDPGGQGGLQQAAVDQVKI